VTLDIPALPLITARFGGDHSGELSIDGVSETFAADSTDQLREAILARVSSVAVELGRPVRVITEDDDGQWLLVVHASGEIGEEERLAADPAADAEERLAHPHRADDLQPDWSEDGIAEPASVLDDAGPSTAQEFGFASLLPSAATGEDADNDHGVVFEHFIAHAPVSARGGDADEQPDDSAPSEAPGTHAEEPFDPASVFVSGLLAEPQPAFEDILDPRVELDTSAHSEPLPAPAPAPAILPLPADLPQPAIPPQSAIQPQSAVHPSTETHPNPSLQIETDPEPAPSEGRASFLTEERRPDRAQKGWRGLLAKTGLPIPASTRERVEREETHAVSQHWAGPRTIAIVNGKGGANKTPTTAMLAAVFARSGGSGVLAWDNNETRGTLGWRTEQGPHDATVQTLLPNTEHLLSPVAQSSDLSHFVHHQTGDKYDVLRSNPAMLATEQRIDTDDFDKLHSVAAKYFRLIFIDSGNDESAERWLRMIDHTDQLVIATTALGEHAEAGALLLEALAQRDERSARLASEAVVIVSQSEKAGAAADARRVAAGFETLARRAVSVPFDPAMHGGRLEYTALTRASRRAWLHAAAAVAEGL
jgi:MinD-like ATPase involved in chromosome partitioning or flagellar assembly